MDGSKFVDFIRGKLIAEMQPFDGENTRPILVLDNCSVHHVQAVSELIDEAGILHFSFLHIALILIQQRKCLATLSTT